MEQGGANLPEINSFESGIDSEEEEEEKKNNDNNN